MKICLVAEGCYPYVMGGVSNWIDSMIRSFPDIEFSLIAIVANRNIRGKYIYQLPDNLKEIYEVYLDDFNYLPTKKHKKYKLNKLEYEAVFNMIMDHKLNWQIIFELFSKKELNVDDFLMSPDFYHIIRACYDRKYQNIVFSDFLWTMRSIYLPFFLVLKSDLPKADLYHTVATGYSGVIGAMAKHRYNANLLVSEHGIYTREREEEIIKAKWVDGIYKDIWIEQFKKMSKLAYDSADIVTSLYEHAKELQLELGLDVNKARVIPNGIDASRFKDINNIKDDDSINIGAILRVAPIKDVKTMIQSFAFAKKNNSKLKLWIMGPLDEEENYARECFELVDILDVKDVIFTGRVDIVEYLGKMDFTILTSISEGQPLTILESYAAKKPVIATDVGDCRGLIYGYNDDYGDAGILTHIMNVEEISQAMLEMANNLDSVKIMGENGYRRFEAFYQIEQMKKSYKEIYQSFKGKE